MGWFWMKRVHIVGRKNSGKTTLIVDLIDKFSHQGFRVGTIKHTHHDHELDTPGKDSHRHRQAGSVAVGILTQRMNAVFWPKNDIESAGEGESDRYQQFETMMDDCDIVLVEGDSRTSATRIEVFRSALGIEPMAAFDPDITAVITDDPLGTTWSENSGRQPKPPTWKRNDVGAIAANIRSLLDLPTTGK